MGRIHYTNRKIEGLKLGQVLKRIPPRTGSKAALRDPVIDLDLSGKHLTDGGFLDIASALVEALAYGDDQGRYTRLEELSLKENDLSLVSLESLIPIVTLACHDLRDLDLSGNLIQINSAREVAIWENFLTSLEQCCTLRRLDLSGNLLGHRGFEVLLRVYAKEKPVDLRLPFDLEQWQGYPHSGAPDYIIPGMRKMSLVSESDEYSGGVSSEPGVSKRKGSRHDSKSPEKPGGDAMQMDLQVMFSTTQGLRSVPYLILCETGMTETCALHLSFIVEGHNMPDQLLKRVPPARAASHTQQILAYDESQCRGIIYHSNASLGNAGVKVLELAEMRRSQQYRANEELSDPLRQSSGASGSLRRVSEGDVVNPNTALPRRRRSTPTEALDDSGLEAELERARSRIQGNTLQDAGPHSNDLWGAAIRLLAIGRHFLPQLDRLNQPTPSAPAPAAAKAKAPIVKTLMVPSFTKPKMLKPLTPLTVEKDPNQPVNPWNTNFLRKKDDSIPPTPTVIPPTPLTLAIKADSPDTVTKHRPSLSMEDRYRTKLPCGFPDSVWAKILGHVIDAEGILSDDQMLSVLRYATNRVTLSRERESLGLTYATQIWRILESTGCLTYEMDV
ncbi:hypothetical protein ACLMJK_005411 [Lecanora helva]